MIVLGRFDIAYAASAMCRFNMLPLEGHLKEQMIILSYLITLRKGHAIIDTPYLDHSMYPIEDHSNLVDISPEKGPRLRITFYVDDDYAHDLVIGRSITGILVMLKNTPVI
jgi:hypothetical protein